MTVSYYINKSIQNVERTGYLPHRDEFLRLDLNENPGGLPEAFVKNVLNEITPQFVSQYPEMEDFTQTLADFLGCKPDNLCIVNGSSEGIRFIIEAFTQPGGRIVGVTPTYAMYAVYSEMYDRQFVGVPYQDDLSMPIDDILKAITDDTELVIVLNPNNPIGNTYTKEEMDLIVKRSKDCEATLLIDEAYIYFYPNEFLDYALTNEHVFVARTFSKLFSLAGLRLGYIVGWPEGARILRSLCTPHNVNAIAMLFASKILETPGMIDSLVDKQLSGKEFLVQSLIDNGYDIHSQEGNFIFIKTKTDPYIIVDRMKKEKKILIKTYDGIGRLGKCLRVTTAEKRYMEIFLNALLELDKPNSID